MNGAMKNLPSPEIVADAIVRAIMRPRRARIVPWNYRPAVWLVKAFPGAVDVVFGDARVQRRLNRDSRAARGCHASANDAHERSDRRHRRLERDRRRRRPDVRRGAGTRVRRRAQRCGCSARRNAARQGPARPARRDGRRPIAAAARTVARAGVPLRALVNNAGVAVGGPLEVSAGRRHAPSVRGQRVRAGRRHAGDVAMLRATWGRSFSSARSQAVSLRRSSGRTAHRSSRSARSRMRCASNCARRDRRHADRAGFGEDADLAERARLTRTFALRAARRGDRTLRRTSSKTVRRHRTRGARRHARRCRHGRDRRTP